jgi:NAD(P)-dependent dehydrogenase (short-subunit alcohol dehydrogenase family)/AcrR family transcriptional regulator
MDTIPTSIKSKKLVEQKREQIVLAAIKQFPRKGFIRTTLRELSQAAGISHANIYNYVGNKDDIFVLVHEFITDLVDQEIDQAIENIQDPLEKLRRMIRAEFDLSYEWADAILFVYQDIHVLSKAVLKRLLKRESEHVLRFKIVLDECVEKGLLRYCNTHVVANLIKIMVDSWVIRRWDLKGVNRSEMENSILNLTLNGLLNDEINRSRPLAGSESLEGKSVLLLNGTTVFGEAIASLLCARGARLGVYTFENHTSKEIGFSGSVQAKYEEARFYSASEHGPMTPWLFNQIVKDFGQIDIVLQDLGVSDIDTHSKKSMELGSQRLDENFRCARDLSRVLQIEMSSRGSGRIVFLAPSAWFSYVDLLRYETAKAEAIALTKTLARKMASRHVNVNCIIPGFIGGGRNLLLEKEKASELLNQIPSRSLGEVSDIIESVYFLISDSSKYLTGQVLEVDGGMNQMQL